MPPSGKKRIPRLSELEWEVVKPLWEKGPLPARDIYRSSPTEQQWAYKTVKTMLARLVKKGALRYTEVGNTYVYEAVYTREEMTSAAAGTFVRRVFDGALSPFFAHFVERASEEELRVLRAELSRLSREQRKRAQDK